MFSLAVVVVRSCVLLVNLAIVRFKRYRPLKSPVASQVNQYERAHVEWQARESEQARARKKARRQEHKDKALQREVEWERQEAERARRKAEEAFAEWRLEAERARQEATKMAQEEAERIQREAERARQEAERGQLEEERAREEARREALRKHEEYWNGLSGLEFEKELGILCERRGYKVSFTPVSGDEGVDLILQKDGKKTVVQCKGHKSPAGPAVVRELYGTMFHFDADKAILACTGGFTKGAKNFASGKPIILVAALDLARMSEIIEGNAN